jgi:hypothetical protein
MCGMLSYGGLVGQERMELGGNVAQGIRLAAIGWDLNVLGWVGAIAVGDGFRGAGASGAFD